MRHRISFHASAAKRLIGLMTAIAFVSLAMPALAKTAAKPAPKRTPLPRVTAQAWIVADAKTGKVLASYHPDVKRSIASLTKLMTVRVATDIGLDMDQVVSLADEDEVGGGRLRVPVGTPLTIRNVLAATLVGSANNTANALARSTGLSREDFVARMNATATSSGLTHTSFVEPTGIEAGNVSTAREVLAMSRVAFSDPLVLSMSEVPHYSVEIADGVSPPHDIKNTDLLLSDPSVNVIAGKTGFTYEAGYALTTELSKSGHNLIVVVLGSRTKRRSFSEAKALANWSWKNRLN